MALRKHKAENLTESQQKTFLPFCPVFLYLEKKKGMCSHIPYFFGKECQNLSQKSLVVASSPPIAAAAAS